MAHRNPTRAEAAAYPLRPSRAVTSKGATAAAVTPARISPAVGVARVPRMNAATSPAIPPIVPANPSRPIPGEVT